MNMSDLKSKSDEYWKEKLDPEQYRVLRQKGTEAPFTGKFNNNFESGMYECAACGQELFSSDTKFHSDCGWPSFDRSLEGNVEFKEDFSHGMHRIEVLCKNCGGHLGHVFDDAPPVATFGGASVRQETTGKRFCINSAALQFKVGK